MAVYDLGTITTGKVSLFKVSATSSVDNVVLSYAYKNGKLPPGLSVNPDGEIIGTCGDATFEMDNGETTFDETTFTIDKKYTFTVEANGQFGNVSGTQQYSIDVVKGPIKNATNIYGTLRPDNQSLDDWQALVLNTKVFVNDTIYRANDENFSTTIPKFLFLSGVELKLTSTILSLMKYNNYNFKLSVGDFELAYAKDTAGNVIYEIVYCVLTDPNQGANDSKILSLVDLPALTVQIKSDSLEIIADESFPLPNKTQDKLFSNDIINMQNELKDGLTINNFDYLPSWMKTPASPVRGWRLALPIRYLKPGEGEQALYRLKNEITYDPKQLNVTIDRWVMDNNLGTTFDTVSDVTYTGDGSSTVFTNVYNVTAKNHLIVTIDGLGTTAYTLNASATTPQITFDSAPADGTSVVIKMQNTTFGNLVDTTFTSTTFDSDGTRFIGEAVFFDTKDNNQQQLYFTKSSVTDNITHISKHRELVRTV